MRIANGATNNYHIYADWQANNRVITDASAIIKWQASYYPYGETSLITTVISNDFTFAGNEERSNIHLNFFHARWYDPTTGRFMTRDPEERGPWHTQNSNLYAYPYNRPQTFVDKGGEGLGAAVVGGIFGFFGAGLWCAGTGGKDCWGAALAGGAAGFVAGLTFGASLLAMGAGTLGGTITVTGAAAVQAGMIAGVVSGAYGAAAQYLIDGVRTGKKFDPGEFVLTVTLGGALGMGGGLLAGRAAALRYEYTKAVQALEAKGDDLLTQRYSNEFVGRTLSAERGELAFQFKQRWPAPIRGIVNLRNLHEYGDPNGATMDYLLTKYNGDWGRIIEAAARPGHILSPRFFG